MPIKEKLEQIFQAIRVHFDEMDAIREKVLPIQRQIVRSCSEIIKKIHRGDFDKLETAIAATRKELQNMQATLTNAPGEFQTDYLQVAQQELGEATILYYLLAKNEVITPDAVGIGLTEYTYALADVVGELRRFVMNSLREEKLEQAKKAFDDMNQIYDFMFTLDYPNGLLPGLRNKIDQVRGILAKTEGDLVVTTNILRLNRNLERSFSENSK